MKDRIAKDIKQRIVERKMTRIRVCEKAGMSSQTFYEILSGGNYRISSLIKVLNVLNMDIKLYNL